MRTGRPKEENAKRKTITIRLTEDLYIYLYSFLSPFAVNCNLFHHTTLSVRSHHECPLSVAPMDIFL